MEIKFKSRYSLDWKRHEGTIDIEGLLSYIKEYGDLRSEDDLEDCISDYLWDSDHDDLVSKEDVNSLDEIDDIEVLNLEDLVNHLRYLIKERTCCDRADYSANYCPKCGKKLK